MRKQSWLVVVIVALASAAVVAGTSSYGGQLTRSDLFRKFFTWTGTGNVTLSPGTTISAVNHSGTAASGSDAFSVATNGARVHFGLGSADYAVSNGSNMVMFADVISTGNSVGAGFTIGTNQGAGNGRLIFPSGRYFDENTSIGNIRIRASGLDFGDTGVSLTIQGSVLGVTSAPTIASGFGTGPTVVASNGTFAFEVNVGTGGTASAGVIGLPAATTGWVCNCQDITTPSTNVTRMTANGTTSCTVTNSAFGTGLATAWSASDKLWCTAFAL